MTSLLFAEPKLCGWCLDQTATTMLYATPTCMGCAVAPAKQRVNAWLRQVYAHTQTGTGNK